MYKLPSASFVSLRTIQGLDQVVEVLQHPLISRYNIAKTSYLRCMFM